MVYENSSMVVEAHVDARSSVVRRMDIISTDNIATTRADGIYSLVKNMYDSRRSLGVHPYVEMDRSTGVNVLSQPGAAIRGEDAYHRRCRETTGKPPIQVGVYELDPADTFADGYQAMIRRTGVFMREKMWLPSGFMRVPHIIGSDGDLYDDIDQTESISLYGHAASSRIYVFFNHEFVGGGDFLEWGTFVLGGDSATSASLLPLPSAWQLFGSLLKLAITAPFHPMLRSRPHATGSLSYQPRVFRTEVRLSELDRAVAARKFQLVHTVLRFIFAGGGHTFCRGGRVLAWLPVGFQKKPGSQCNNIGIVPFVARADDTAGDVQSAALAQRHHAVGSLALQQRLPSANGVAVSKYVKERVHVVLTMGSVDRQDSSGVQCRGIASGFLAGSYSEVTNSPYPFYCVVASVGEYAHITLTVHDAGFDASVVDKMPKWRVCSIPFLNAE